MKVEYNGLEHAIPQDGFAHVESMNCPCQPYVDGVPWIGVAVCHRFVEGAIAPDCLPEDWT